MVFQELLQGTNLSLKLLKNTFFTTGEFGFNLIRASVKHNLIFQKLPNFPSLPLF